MPLVPRYTAGAIPRVKAFAGNEKMTGLLMLLMGLAGLAMSNMPILSRIYWNISNTTVHIPLPHLDLPVSAWVQDCLLALFFLVIGLDLRQDMVTGFLKNPRNATAPILGAICGVAVPAVLFSVINLSSPLTSGGWTIPTATDIAFSATMLSLASKHVKAPIRSFLLTLATVDDVIGILLIAIVYSHPSSIPALIALVACLICWYLFTRVRKPAVPVLMIIGAGAWYAMMLAGMHPTLAGVAIGLLTPAHPLHGETISRVDRYRHRLSPISAVIVLPVFAFFAMGIPLGNINMGTITSTLFLGVVVGLVVGKPLGIMVALKVCDMAGLSSGDRPSFMHMLGVSQLCGIGFTVAFLMSGLSFSNQQTVDIARLGVLVGSLLSCLLGTLFIKIGEYREHS